MNKKQQLIQKILFLYNINIDFMGEYIKKETVLTFHHINEEEKVKPKKAKTTLINSAVLTQNNHNILNTLKLYRLDLYELWQDIFKLIHEEEGINEILRNKIYELRYISLNVIKEIKNSKEKVKGSEL